MEYGWDRTVILSVLLSFLFTVHRNNQNIAFQSVWKSFKPYIIIHFNYECIISHSTIPFKEQYPQLH